MPWNQQPVQLPHELEIGKSCTFLFPLRPLAVGLIEKGFRGQVKLKPVVSAQNGRTDEGKEIVADTDDWAKAS